MASVATTCCSSINSSLVTASLRRSAPAKTTTITSSLSLTQSLSPSWDLKKLKFSVSRQPKLHRFCVFVPRSELSTEEVQALDAPVEDEAFDAPAPDDTFDAGSEDESAAETVAELEPPPEEPKLYVGNLPWSCTADELADVFSKVGGVELAEVIYDRVTGRSRGFGFVTMSSFEDADAAIEKLNGADYAGRTIRVNYPNRGRTLGGSGFTPRPRYNDNTNKLFVGNLAWGVDSDMLGEIFSEHGKVLDARVVTDRETGRSRGFGFVTYSSEDEVNEALNKMDGAVIEGRSLRVNLAGERPAAKDDLF